MKNISIRFFLCAISTIFTANADDNVTQITDKPLIAVSMVSGHVNGRLLRPYNLSWVQCSFKDGQWTTGAPFSERISIIDDTTLQVVQSTGVGGQSSVSTHTLDRDSLARSLLEREIRDDAGNVLAHTSTMFTPTGYTTTIKTNSDEQSKTGKINSSMYSGMFLGLPLATLDFSRGSFELSASMLSFDGTYKVTAWSAGTQTFEVDGQSIESTMVDVHWLHNESGDVYAPGPDASGGRYWLLKTPPEGVPHVLAYKTDSYAIEFVQQTCNYQ